MPSPIIYKQIPTQYAFFIEKYSTVIVSLLTKLDKMKFKDMKEAMVYIKSLKHIL